MNPSVRCSYSVMLLPPCLLRGFHDTPRRCRRAGLCKHYPAHRGPNRGEVSWRTSEGVSGDKWPEMCSGSAGLASTPCNQPCESMESRNTDLRALGALG